MRGYCSLVMLTIEQEPVNRSERVYTLSRNARLNRAETGKDVEMGFDVRLRVLRKLHIEDLEQT